jgi:hypothetical protein
VGGVPQQLFSSAVACYAQYRSAYPQDLVDALAAGAGNITWREGDSSQIAVFAGPGADLAVFATSFHWTDRPAVLATLDEVLAPGGAVVGQLTGEEVTGLQLSYSFSTPALLGGNTRAFSRDIRAAVLDLHPAGVVTEPFRVEVLIAARP